MQFGNVDFGTGRTFGVGATFDTNMDFVTGSYDHDFTAKEMVFKAGTLLPSGETFGEHPDFDGIIDFPDTFTFPAGAEFALNQTFTSSENPTFDDFGVYATGMEFGKARDFKNSPYFDGSATFVGANTFGAGAEFNTGPTFTEAQTFSGAADFGANTDFTAVAQSITTGSQFGAGSTFITDSTQTLPKATVLSSGLLLEATTCTTSTCLPTDLSKVLEKGEKNLAGVDLDPIKNTVTKDKPILNVEGLGITLDMGTVSTDGNVDVDVLSPTDSVISSVSTPVGTDGTLSVTTSTGAGMNTISSVVNISKTGTTANSGTMTITLPYTDAAATSAGILESDLNVLHFTGGEWITESGCTVDTTANEITCTGVTSLSPFSVGGTASSGGGSKDFGAPTFTTDLEINGTSLSENSGNTITVTEGQKVNIDISATDSHGPENITYLDIYYNHDGTQVLNNLQESFIAFENEELISEDPNNLLESVSMFTILADDFKTFTFDLVFGDDFETSDILVRAWDLSGNSSSLYYKDALKVLPSDEIFDDGCFNCTDNTVDELVPLSSVPSWIKNNAEWWADDSIDDYTFVTGIQWMVNNDVITVVPSDDLGLSTSDRAIPSWIKNNAEWWADDVISDGEFVKGIEYLINTKIIIIS